MALPALLNGGDCGPLNPLQSLSKQFDKDRGIQLDHFGLGQAGPSRQVFRTQVTPTPGLGEEAARFFSGQPSSAAFASQHVPNSFDLSSLHDSLPHPQFSINPHPSSWAGDFLNQKVQSPISPRHAQVESSYQYPDVDRMEPPYMHYSLPINNRFVNGAFGPPPVQHVPIFQNVAPPELHQQDSEPDPTIISADFPQEKAQIFSEPIDADELSRTAGLLVDTVKGETNPKFHNSAFLALMRQLRDKEMVVEGTDMVKAHASPMDAVPSTAWVQDFTNSTDVKGKGKARAENGFADSVLESTGSRLTASEASHIAQDQGAFPEIYGTPITDASDELFARHRPHPAPGVSVARKSVHFSRPEVLERDDIPNDQTGAEVEDADDKFWRQENSDYQDYWRRSRLPDALHGNPEWEQLQADWDRFEATATGIKPVSAYQFQPNNPYLEANYSTRNHTIHTRQLNSNQSVLEKEAAVQRDIQSPAAWFELGVKQQENERERRAIQALQRAVELDPSYLEAWLALSISHSNEGNRTGAYDAIEQWILNNTRYEGQPFIASLGKGDEKMAGERVEELIQCLMGLVRETSNGEVDADIQTALGVLLTTREEYAKAQDCFRAALAVRPNDWLLYNRVGATLANSGHPDDAMWFYYQALELNPSYIRARFNLGISHINLKRYDEAAEHILDALVLQERDTSDGPDARGVTSLALWECLRTACIQLQRPELASLCDLQDLEGFRKAYWT